MFEAWKKCGCPSLLAAAFLVLSGETSLSQPASVSYGGKTITIVVGFGAGGGYDLYARLVAAHLGKHLRGKPNVVVQNAPGAASVKAAMTIYNAAPKDGTSIGLFLSALTVNSVLTKGYEFQADKFTWIGRVNDSATLGIVWHTTGVQTLDQAKERELIMGSTGASGNSAMVPWALNALVGTKFKVVPGYTSSPALALAMEQGEANGIGAVSMEYLTTSKPEWLQEKKVNMLYVIDLRRKKSLPDVPAIVEFAQVDDARQVLALLGSASAVGYAFAAPPGVSKDVAATLRGAFTAITKDPEFLAEAAKRKLEIDALGGDEVQQVVSAAVATQPAIVEKARRATARP